MSCKKAAIFSMLAALGAAVSVFASGKDSHADLVGIAKQLGLTNRLGAAVKVRPGKADTISIVDEGDFLFQYLIESPAVSSEPNIVIHPSVENVYSRDNVVIITHGWLDKARDGWPMQMTEAIASKVDPNDWVCCCYDWQGGAQTLNPVDAAKYGRDVAGPRLAAAIKQTFQKPVHVHFVGHSAGCWVINSAAQKTAENFPGASIHITFLDAYIPPGWDADLPADVKTTASLWVEHYYTKDFTAGATNSVLANAYNVDLTGIDPWFKEHEFPWRWYHATIVGRYVHRPAEKSLELIKTAEGIEYGFARSKEASAENFAFSLTLQPRGRTITLRKSK